MQLYPSFLLLFFPSLSFASMPLPLPESDYTKRLEAFKAKVQASWIDDASDGDDDGLARIEELLMAGLFYEGVDLPVRISRFLHSSLRYSVAKKHWTRSGNTLVASFTALINDILRHFGQSLTKRMAVLDVAGWRERSPGKQGSDILVLGCTSLTPEAVINVQNPNEAFSVTPVLVIPEHESGPDDIFRAGLRARDILRRQQSRRFIHSLILSETHIQMIHLDHGGGVSTRRFNIHANPEIFVKMVLITASLTDSVLGHDLDIVYETPNVRKLLMLSPTSSLPFPGSSSQPAIYQVHPWRHEARDSLPYVPSRGTTCWLAMDENGNKRFIKDVWRPAYRKPEYIYLTAALLVDGVGQMASYQEYMDTTLDNRHSIMPPYPLNWIRSRLVLRCYGRPLPFFTSQPQLLAAFRDAVAGHRNLLLRADILHRNITPYNILLGDSQHVGNRGVIVDMTTAVYADTDPTKYEETESSPFLSVRRLSTATRNQRNTYLDDLESFFYVLTWIVFGLERPGVRRDPLPPFLEAWGSSDPDLCAANKRALLRQSLAGPVSDYFSPVLLVLLNRLRVFLNTRLQPHHQYTVFKYGNDADVVRNDYIAFLTIVSDAEVALSKELREESEAVGAAPIASAVPVASGVSPSLPKDIPIVMSKPQIPLSGPLCAVQKQLAGPSKAIAVKKPAVKRSPRSVKKHSSSSTARALGKGMPVVSPRSRRTLRRGGTN